MRLIDADALIKRWNNMSVRGRTEFDQEIMVAPTIDAVSVVRCKECKYWTPWHCSQFNDHTHEVDFCSYGERKETDHE